MSVPPHWKYSVEFTRKQFWTVKGWMFFFALVVLYFLISSAINFGYELCEKQYSQAAPIITYYQEGIPVCTDTEGNIFFVSKKKGGGIQITGSAIKR